MTEEWKNMTVEAKNKYNVEAKDLLEKYKVQLKKWETAMMKEGYYNLLSVKPTVEVRKREK